MNNQDQEVLLEAYRQCFESKHHYDILSWTIATVVIVFVGVLLSVIPRIHVESEVLTVICKLLAAGVGWSMLLLWYRIYERNRLWGEVSNETARDIEKLLKLDGPAHAFMKVALDNEVTLKNTDIAGAAHSGKAAFVETCSAGSIHKSIHAVIWVLAFVLLAAVFVSYEI